MRGDASFSPNVRFVPNLSGKDHLEMIMSYISAHQKIYRVRGKASDFKCVSCDNQASQWAYNHQDPNERTGTWDGRDATYSEDPEFYYPMCSRCHIKFDNDHRGYSANRNEQKTHCPEGHEYNDENTRISKRGGRHCKTCHAEKERVRYQKLRQKGMSRADIRSRKEK